jgi:toxin ParE1/3/4
VDAGDPETAFRFRKAVRESLDRIRQHPRIGSLCRGSIQGLRSWPANGFEIIRIYYIETPESLRVVRILHGSRDVRKILRKEKPVRD